MVFRVESWTLLFRRISSPLKAFKTLNEHDLLGTQNLLKRHLWSQQRKETRSTYIKEYYYSQYLLNCAKKRLYRFRKILIQLWTKLILSDSDMNVTLINLKCCNFNQKPFNPKATQNTFSTFSFTGLTTIAFFVPIK